MDCSFPLGLGKDHLCKRKIKVILMKDHEGDFGVYVIPSRSAL